MGENVDYKSIMVSVVGYSGYEQCSGRIKIHDFYKIVLASLQRAHRSKLHSDRRQM